LSVQGVRSEETNLKEQLLHLFIEYKEYAIAISIFVNIVIAVLAVIPSVFITAVNVTFFGFWDGMWISFLGESIGALVAFIAYRKGIKLFTVKEKLTHPNIKKLLHTNGKDAFLLILWLRLLPFMPSGLVTVIAALGNVSLLVYFCASSIGKLPSTLLEAYTTNEVINFTLEGKIILGVSLVIVMIYYVKRRSKSIEK
jgi:uncharacterized membrane protein YdjX (TVP38/TMEM64 family)